MRTRTSPHAPAHTSATNKAGLTGLTGNMHSSTRQRHKQQSDGESDGEVERFMSVSNRKQREDTTRLDLDQLGKD